MDRLPIEIFWQIFRNIEDDDILHLPLSWVIFGLADRRAKDRFQVIKVSLSQSGLRGLCRIASHPVVAPRVKTLIFYSGNIIIESGEREPSKDRLTAPQQLPQNLAFENDYYFTHKVFIPFAYQYAEHQGYKFAKAKEDVHQLKLVLEKLQNLERIQVGGGDLSTLPISGLSFATSTNVLMKDITYFLRVLVEALRAIYFL